MQATDIKRTALTLLLFVLFCIPRGTVRAGEPLLISTGHWPPYTLQTAENGGLALEVVSAAFALRGIEVKYEWLPWARAMQYTKKGKRIASAVWYHNMQREQEFEFSAPILRHRINFYMLEHRTLGWQQLEDLAGLRIGTLIGHSYGEAFDLAAELGVVQHFPVVSNAQNIRKLLSGRIDLVLAEQRTFDWTLQGFSIDEQLRITAHPKALTYLNTYLLFNKTFAEQKQLRREFNLGLLQLRQSGELARMAGENLPYAPQLPPHPQER